MHILKNEITEKKMLNKLRSGFQSFWKLMEKLLAYKHKYPKNKHVYVCEMSERTLLVYLGKGGPCVLS